MVEFGAPYALDGTVIPGAGLRRQMQDAVGEGSGVVRSGDLKCTQLPTPGAGVRIAAGNDLIQSRDPGALRETYGIPLFTTQNYLGDSGAGLVGTSSSGPRRDMIFHEVLDPNLPTHYTPQANWPAGASSKLSVIQGVPAGAKRIEDVPALASVTGYALMAINYPPSTATVTNAMIEDLRRVQSPKTEEQIITYSLVGGDEEVLTATGANGEVWPNAFTNSTERAVIPDWATQVDISVMWNGVECLSAAATTAVWLQIAGATADPGTGPNIISQKTTLRGNATFAVADRRGVPAALRGTTQRVYGMARLVGSVTGTNRPKLDAQSSMQIRLVWRQIAE